MKKYRFHLLMTVIFIFGSILIKAENCSTTNTDITDILIIYSSGYPYASISDIEAPEFDELTTPTPVFINCEKIARRLDILFQEKGLKTKTLKVSKIKRWKELLNSKAVILGSPTYFWNMSWEMKRLMDEKFGQIYIYHKEKSEIPKFCIFTLAEIEPSANQTLRKIEQVLHDCNLVVGHQMTLLTKHNVKDVEWRLIKFVDEIYRDLKSGE